MSTNYVVIDTMMFSSSVVSLLDSGVNSVIPIHPDQHIQDIEGDIMVGSETADSDFRNSPQNIYGIFGFMDSVPETVGLQSSNGAKLTLQTINQSDLSSDNIIIGCLMNAAKVASFLKDSDNSYSILTAGSNGEVAVEDIITKKLIQREINNEPIDYQNIKSYTEQLPVERVFDDTAYEWISEEDIHHVTDINSKNIIPVVNQVSEKIEKSCL